MCALCSQPAIKNNNNVQMCPKQQTHKAYQSLLHPEQYGNLAECDCEAHKNVKFIINFKFI